MDSEIIFFHYWGSEDLSPISSFLDLIKAQTDFDGIEINIPKE